MKLVLCLLLWVFVSNINPTGTGVGVGVGGSSLMFPSPVIPAPLGVNIHFTTPQNGELKMLSASGFHFVRMDFNWGATERSQGVYDFSSYDVLVKNLDQFSMKALFILDYTNVLYDGNLSPHTDAGRAAFAKWAAAATTHFEGRGYLWEMYNEPNIGFWKPTPNVTQYTQLALAVGKAIKQATPNELYIGPATSTFDWKFIESSFEGGVLQFFDCVSIHPYRQDWPESVAADYATLNGFITKYAPQGKHIPIISSEWGYSTLYSRMNLTNQGLVLPRMLLTNLANNINLSIWYDWHDDGVDPTDIEHHFGTVYNQYYANRDPCYDPKPNYHSAQTLMTTLAGFTYKQNIGSSADYVYKFENGSGVAAYAAWTTTTNHSISFPVAGKSYATISYLGTNEGTISANSNGMVTITLSGAVIYLKLQ